MRTSWRTIAVGAVVLIVVAALGTRWFASTARASVRSAAYRAAAAVKAAVRPRSPATDPRDVKRLAKLDDWFTFAHDDRRSGLERTPTGINRETVGSLQMRWRHTLPEPVRASPLAVGGTVYLAGDKGTVFALDAATGDVLWKRSIGNSIRMTPALVNGALLVGVYGRFGQPGTKPFGAAFLSLDAATGAVRWRTPLPGLVRSEPVVIDGVIYEGLAGGDRFSGCFDGRIVALSEKTGALLPMAWRTSARANNGGGIWGPLSTDGTAIYVGTGNTCDENVGMGDSVVALTRSLKLVWHTSTRVAGVEDSDVGGGVVLDENGTRVAGKSGYLYELDRRSGAIVRLADLAPWARNGGSIGTPTGDGTVTVISGGEEHNPDVAGSLAGSVITGFDRHGRVLYRLHSSSVVSGYAAFVSGIGFLVLDRELVAFDAATGERRWSSDLGDSAYASPVVVPSGVYAATDGGDVFAFDSRAASATAVTALESRLSASGGGQGEGARPVLRH